MFPSFNSLADKEAKRRDLLRQIQKNVDLAKIQQEAYANAMWASDVAKNTISLDPIKASASTQTSDSSTSSNGVFSLDPPGSSSASSTASSTQTRIMTTDRQIQTRPNVSNMATSMDTPFRTETDMMREEDYQSDLMRHRDYIWEQKDDLRKQGNIIGKQRKQIESLNHQINEMNGAFEKAKVQFERLVGEHQYSNRQIALLMKEFEDGRQLYLNLRAAAETIQYERDITKSELEDYKKEFARGEELYYALGAAYKGLMENFDALQGDASSRYLDYERIIDDLKRENATATARLLEQQQQQLNASVSTATSKNTRSQKNTPQALREFMQTHGIEEAPAATSFSRVSTKIVFVIKNGNLHKRQNNKPDVNLEDGSRTAAEALTSLDPVWTMVAIKNGVPPGTLMDRNSLFKQEAEGIRESGKLLTHQEASELKQRQNTARRNLPAIVDPSSITTPTGRKKSFKNNVSPVKEKKNSNWDVDMDDSDVDMGKGFMRQGKILTGRGLRGAGGVKPHVANLKYCGGASAFDYKQIGSKFIRLPDLHSNILNLKQPNRTSIGRKKKISGELTKVIKDLVYDGHVNQDLYDKLSISEKNTFTDILKITHLQWQLKDGWRDPNSTLRAEFDKLRGEVALGNDNPDLIRQLKSMTVDLYSQKLISEDDFKTIFNLV